MLNLLWWEWVLLGAGVYVAIVSLARLMQGRRESLVAELTRQAADEQRQQKKEEKQRRKRELAAQRLKELQESKRRAA